MPHDVTGILFRHPKHGAFMKNVPNEEEVSTLQGIGHWLRARKLDIDRVCSSPQWRAILAIAEVLKGYGNMLPLDAVMPGLGDLSTETDIDLDTLKAAAKEAGKGVEPFLLEYSPLKETMQRRGREGADALIEAAKATAPGKAFLACSHGGSRIEASVMTLFNMTVGEDKPPFLVVECEIVFLHFKTDGTCTTYHYIGIPAC